MLLKSFIASVAVMLMLGVSCGVTTVEPETACHEHADCQLGAFCVNGECVVEADCEEDEDCGEQGFCSEGRCFLTCEDDDGCGADFVCEEEVCIAACASDDDCEGVCGDDGRCLPPEQTCKSHEDCSSDEPWCMESEGVCVACLDNEHCTDEKVCVEGECVLDACESDEDCAGEEVCVDGECRAEGDECDANNPCEEGQICIAGYCVKGCWSVVDCPEGMKCDPDAGTYGACVECLEDDHCPDDTTCIDGACIVCLDDDDCEEGSICLDGECVMGCREDADCDQTEKPFCDTDAGTCVECLDDNDCGDLVCDVDAGECEECITEDHCPENMFCEPNSRLCVECYVDEHCDGAKCDEDTFLCEGCVTDDACAPDERCATAYNECWPAAPSGLCNACSTDDDCPGEENLCVAFESWTGDVIDHGCGIDCSGNVDCPRGFACEEVGNGSVQCVPHYGDQTRLRTCAAHRTIGGECDRQPFPSPDDNESCGVPDEDDAYCANEDDSVQPGIRWSCSIPCIDESQCPDGYLCEEDAMAMVPRKRCVPETSAP